MSPQEDPPPHPSGRARRDRRPRVAGRGRAIVLTLLVVVFVLLISLRGIASFYTDYLWFDSLHLSSLWRDVLTAKAGLTVFGGLAFFALCWVNLSIAERLAPVFRPSAGDDDLIERYYEVIGRRAWLVRASVSVFLAAVVGMSLGSAWKEWVLFNNRVDFGAKDATFSTDIGFYVFQLPFISAALSWLFSSLVVIFIVAVLAHIVNGGIRFHNQLDRVTPQVKAHLSVLLGFLALVQCARYWFGHYALTLSTRGSVDGATYTEYNVTLRAIYLVMLIALFAFGLFIANIWRRGWVLPVMAVSLWVLVSVLAGTIVPAVVERVRVNPTRSLESEYIARNIAATRAAYGLDVEDDMWDWTQPLTASDLAENADTMDNVRLWDPTLIQRSFAADQSTRPFYDIGDVDVDRYEVDGVTRQVMLAARDLDPSGINSPTWEATHLVYTNGYGMVAALGNDKTSNGDPEMLVKDIPVESARGLPEVTEPRIYFGEDSGGYVIVNTDVKAPSDELAAGKGALQPYDGADGIRFGAGVTGFLRKAAFSLRFGEIDPLLSGNIRSDSRVLLDRDVKDRVEALAPFLAFDHDPYLVLTEGRLQYVVDGYTTTRNYPNSQRADTGGLDPSSGLYGRSFNYVRNSVKAVVDAYQGTVTFYVVDQHDPLIRGYEKAFPQLFTDGDEMPEDLRQHLRYPEDLFTVQTQMWAKYHVTDPDTFDKSLENWDIPRDVGVTQKAGSDDFTAVGADGQKLTKEDRYPSQYVLMQAPGEDEATFQILRPYVSSSETESSGGNNQLRAFITGEVDPDTGLGRLRQFRLDTTDPPPGPNLAADDIQGSAAVTEVVRPLCLDKQNNTCTFASPTIVPVANALLYVQSFLVAGSQQAAPRLRYVIVNYVNAEGSNVRIATSLRGALVELFGEDVPTSIEGSVGATDETTPSDQPTDEEPVNVTDREAELIDDIVSAFDAAEAAAAKGDLVGQATELQKARDLAEELQSLRSGSGSAGEGGTTTTTAPTTDTTTTAPAATTTAPAATTTTAAGA
ncbi:MAG: UPF0182 family protein [Acidimicrobiales bacterium]